MIFCLTHLTNIISSQFIMYYLYDLYSDYYFMDDKFTIILVLPYTFYPIVKNTMEEIKALKAYNDYMGKHSSNPLARLMDLDLDISKYVTDKAIDGLFIMVAKEEKKIRQDPAARVTDLLKSIFGKADKSGE